MKYNLKLNDRKKTEILKNINKLVNRIFYYLKKITFEVIIVDDNSEDSTEINIKQLTNLHKNIIYIKRVEKIRDLSRSCQLGIKKALYKKILIKQKVSLKKLKFKFRKV
jgi:glycosyltransferase involved in cell wall biosynthesis